MIRSTRSDDKQPSIGRDPLTEALRAAPGKPDTRTYPALMPLREIISLLLAVIGAALFVTGAFLLSVPAGLTSLGCILIVFGVLIGMGS